MNRLTDQRIEVNLRDPFGITMTERLGDAVTLAAQALVDAMETCHQCSATLLVEDSPTYCSEGGCSYDCEDHEDREKPNCIPISNLHANLKRALSVLLPPKEPKS